MHTDLCRVSAIEISAEHEETVCNLFKMLGDPNRLKIVCALMGTRMCVAHLAAYVGMEQSALSHQLRNLKQAGLVKSEKQGKQVFYSLDDEHVSGMIEQAAAHARHLRPIGGQ
ncbi:MAG TPA: transcriptional regulator [Clostridiales bacterium]|nr:transcriptional regulator [Clostridiales bacterium]